MTRAPNLRIVDNCLNCIHQKGRYCEARSCDLHRDGGEDGFICDDYE